MIAEWSFNSPENLKFLQKSYPEITLANIGASELKNISDEIGSALVYYGNDLMKVYDLVKEGDLTEIKKVHKIIDAEIMKSVSRYNKEAEFYPEKNLYFGYFNPKFHLVSPISTIVSRQDSNKIYIFASDTENNMIKISARNQSGKEDVNLLMKKGINGLIGAIAGGHQKAAAGSIRKQDLNKFKENILR
jgi:nanoRNase/pAp phosphatase (c-di-AMP/oligoRNAs hydrolase)